MRASTSARVAQDAIYTAVRRYGEASFEDVRNYVGMRLPNLPNNRTLLRHLRALVDAGVVQRSGANNHVTYRLEAQP